MRQVKIFVWSLMLILSFSIFMNAVIAAENTAKVVVPVLQVTILDFGSPIDFTSGYKKDQICPANTGGTAQDKCLEIGWIGQYIKAIFQYGVTAAMILTVIMIMIGGFLWLTAGGTPDRVSKGKDFITSALVGMFLALFSYLILTIVNPRLVNIEPVSVKQVAQQDFTCCTDGYMATQTAGGTDACASHGGVASDATTCAQDNCNNPNICPQCWTNITESDASGYDQWSSYSNCVWRDGKCTYPLGGNIVRAAACWYGSPW